MKDVNKRLTLLGLILISVNFLVIYYGDLQLIRILKLISTVTIFSAFFSILKKAERSLLAVFFFLTLADIFLLNYEVVWVKKLTFIAVIAAYTALMLHIKPLIRNLKTTVFQKIVFLVVLGINVLMLYVLIQMVHYRLDDNWHSFLFYIYGITMIIMVILAFSYSNRYSNKASFYFVCSVLAFVFSDITSFIGYYMDLEEFYSAARLFYLLSLLGLIKFATQDKSEGILT